MAGRQDADGVACVLLCRDLDDATGPVAQAIAAAGGEVVAIARRWPELLASVVETGARAAVIDLAMAGRAGVRLVAALRALAPTCRIVVVSELRSVDLASLEAGADVVVSAADLRPLVAVLQGSDVDGSGAVAGDGAGVPPGR